MRTKPRTSRRWWTAIDAYIDAAVRNEYQKLDVYKRISGIENQEEYMDMQDELIDRFGEIPRSVENLLKIADLKALAHQAGVVEVDVKKQDITFRCTRKPIWTSQHSGADGEI